MKNHKCHCCLLLPSIFIFQIYSVTFRADEILWIGGFVILYGKSQNPQKPWNIIHAKTNSVKEVASIFSSKVGQTKVPCINECFNCGANYSTLTRLVPPRFHNQFFIAMSPTSYGLYYMQQYKYIAGLQYFSFPIIHNSPSSICLKILYKFNRIQP